MKNYGFREDAGGVSGAYAPLFMRLFSNIDSVSVQVVDNHP
jgi:hypothetical protein